MQRIYDYLVCSVGSYRSNGVDTHDPDSVHEIIARKELIKSKDVSLSLPFQLFPYFQEIVFTDLLA
jgi:hypothetical protein